jgi:hypothetical protein
MFRDRLTNRQSKEGEKLIKMVVMTRPKTYKRWVKNEETNHYEEVDAGVGYECVRELSVSKEGLELWESWSPEARLAWLKANPS